ncbi:hypothetical protein LINGRAHAP2_LOCUS31982 [Linum grandiflorum]
MTGFIPFLRKRLLKGNPIRVPYILHGLRRSKSSD